MESVMEVTGLKYYKRLKIYKSSTGNVTFDPATMEAYSYSWWKFVTKIKGKVVFNDYSYSSSTSGHQAAVRHVMKQLKIKIDVTVSMRQSLEHLKDGYLPELYKEIYTLEAYNRRKGVKAKTVKDNNDLIKELNGKAKVLKTLGAKITKATLVDIKRGVAVSEAYRVEQLVKQRVANREANREKQEILNNSFINVA